MPENSSKQSSMPTAHRPPQPFSGSYSAEDVEFLLKPVAMHDTPIHIKEQLIQSGQKHYSQLLSYEQPPAPEYLALYQQALAQNKTRLAQDVLNLAAHIASQPRQEIVLVSLARAGTPVGILLKRLLVTRFQRRVQHYSISIIRDLGLDESALLTIVRRHPPQSLVFVDGWTGKGAISHELARSLQRFVEKHHIRIAPDLHVLTDLSGSAAVAATTEDYLIPSCLLNATVSGLISRSVLAEGQVQTGDYHGCYFYQEYRAIDLSNAFIDTVLAQTANLTSQALTSNPDHHRREQVRAFIGELQNRYALASVNLIKPGIGEATRVFLRREAGLLLVKDAANEALRPLLHLAAEKKTSIILAPDLPYRAVALIKVRA